MKNHMRIMWKGIVRTLFCVVSTLFIIVSVLGFIGASYDVGYDAIVGFLLSVIFLAFGIIGVYAQGIRR